MTRSAQGEAYLVVPLHSRVVARRRAERTSVSRYRNHSIPHSSIQLSRCAEQRLEDRGQWTWRTESERTIGSTPAPRIVAQLPFIRQSFTSRADKESWEEQKGRTLTSWRPAVSLVNDHHPFPHGGAPYTLQCQGNALASFGGIDRGPDQEKVL